MGTSTDIDGYYELMLKPGVSLISTKSLTNENVQKRVVIYNSGNLDIKLSENLEQLGEVQISSYASKNVDNANAGQEKIDLDNIKNIPLILGERDIMKVATTLPGISTAGEGSSGFNVRGGKTDQNLILLDDAVIHPPTFLVFSLLLIRLQREKQIFIKEISRQNMVVGFRLFSILKQKMPIQMNFKEKLL